jgi:hypothetical protein
MFSKNFNRFNRFNNISNNISNKRYFSCKYDPPFIFGPLMSSMFFGFLYSGFIMKTISSSHYLLEEKLDKLEQKLDKLEKKIETKK